jgi:hypothetical protein
MTPSAGDHAAACDRVIEHVQSVHARQRMYIDTDDLRESPEPRARFGTTDVRAVHNYLLGLRMGCAACGLQLPRECEERATIDRGWPWSGAGPVVAMRERGLREAEIVDALFAIEVRSWEAFRDWPA